jgi:endonuclease-8
VPEGDTVWRTARRLHAALAGRELLRSDFRVPRYATLDLSGRTVDEAVSRGKHLLIRAGDLTIHSHLKMEGSWQVYRPGERWRKPAFQARVVLENAAATAVGFQLGLLDVVPRAREDEVVGHLGPDLLGPDWDEDEALRRLRLDPGRPVGLALLDQRNLAGIGNIYRCEVCFLAGVHPLAPVGEVADLPRLVRLSKRPRRRLLGLRTGPAALAALRRPGGAHPARQYRPGPAGPVLLPVLPARSHRMMVTDIPQGGR